MQNLFIKKSRLASGNSRNTIRPNWSLCFFYFSQAVNFHKLLILCTYKNYLNKFNKQTRKFLIMCNWRGQGWRIHKIFFSFANFREKERERERFSFDCLLMMSKTSFMYTRHGHTLFQWWWVHPNPILLWISWTGFLLLLCTNIINSSMCIVTDYEKKCLYPQH